MKVLARMRRRRFKGYSLAVHLGKGAWRDSAIFEHIKEGEPANPLVLEAGDTGHDAGGVKMTWSSRLIAGELLSIPWPKVGRIRECLPRQKRASGY
jgi:hypothetical protein